MKYYLAYGSNLNKTQMKHRCPQAKVVGTTILYDYELVFRGVLTIEPKQGSKVPIGVWLITDTCEKALDRYEGYPNFYHKERMLINIDGNCNDAIIYIMNEGREKLNPMPLYLDIVKEGYKDFKFDLAYIDKALE